MIIFSALMVITFKNPVYSVLFLIFNFVCSAMLLFLLDAEFLPIIFIIVYVGAIAVLFLFVVMMLDIKMTETQIDILKYFPIGSFLAIAFLIEILLVLNNTLQSHGVLNNVDYSQPYIFELLKYWEFKPFIADWTNILTSCTTDIAALGNIMYSNYFLYLLLAGLILVVAMLGAVVLTITFNRKSQVQIIYKQVSRNVKNAIFLTV